MVQHHRQQGVRFSWVGADAGYGKDPAFLRSLEKMGETFVVDVHKDQRIFLQDPEPSIPPLQKQHGTQTKPQSKHPHSSPRRPVAQATA